MPTTASDYAQIEEARNRAAQLTKSAGETQAGAYSFGDEVMAKVREARAARGITNLQEDFGRATEQLAGGRQEIVDRNQGELNPMAISNITNQQRAQALGTLAKIGQYEEQNTGTIGEAVQAGANTVEAQAMKIKSQADAAQIELQNLMDVVKQKQIEAQTALENAFREKQFTEGVRQFDQNYALDRIKATADTGSGLDFGQPQGTPPSSKPTQSFAPPPMSAKKGVTKEYPAGTGIIWTSTGDGWE